MCCYAEYWLNDVESSWLTYAGVGCLQMLAEGAEDRKLMSSYVEAVVEGRLSSLELRVAAARRVLGCFGLDMSRQW